VPPDNPLHHLGITPFEILGPVGEVRLCHCDLCRRANGTAFSANARIPLERYRVIKGEDLISEYESSPGARRCFCSRCGSPVPISSGAASLRGREAVRVGYRKIRVARIRITDAGRRALMGDTRALTRRSYLQRDAPLAAGVLPKEGLERRLTRGAGDNVRHFTQAIGGEPCPAPEMH
jgi:hypothetical protein